MIGEFEESQLKQVKEVEDKCLHHGALVNNCRSGPRHTVYIAEPITPDPSNCLLYSIALNKERGSLMYCRELDRGINTSLPSNESACGAGRVSIACFPPPF
jgi:hypothetical protein